MPLHNWADPTGWENFHNLWLSELLRWLRPRLPDGYRVYTGPHARVGLMAAKPDLAVTDIRDPVPPPAAGTAASTAPDDEVAIATLEVGRAVYVQRRGLLVAAIEVVSPRNKDRDAARAESTARYAGYLVGGIHLVLVDLLPRPAGFSAFDAVAAAVGLPNQPPVPVPAAVAYRVGEQIGGERLVAVWRRPMAVGEPLPAIPLPLTVHVDLPIDLESTYRLAAEDAYLT